MASNRRGKGKGPELLFDDKARAEYLTGFRKRESEETGDPHQEENVTTKRLHISGLTASFSKEDLERRFSTFGTVIAVDGLGKRDALGQFRPFAYITLQAPPQQIKRCMNLLSGSVWKGTTLRIGEAKPDFQQRVQIENEKRRQEEEETANNPKKPKRLPPGMGLESNNMEPIDQDAVESGLAWGWKRTPAGHLVRPLRMRPSHPLPRPSRASTLSRVDIEPTEGEEEEQLEASSSRRARVNPRPPTKAHRITIDPTRYGAIHLSGALLEALAGDDAFDATSLGPGEWHCEEIDHDDDDGADEKDHRLVRWAYTAKDGKVLHEEFTKVPVRVVAKSSTYTAPVRASAGDDGEDVMAQLDFDRYSDAGSDDDLFSGFATSIAPAASKSVEPKASAVTSRPAPSAANAAAVDTADIDDLFAGLPSKSSAAATSSINDLFSDLPSTSSAPATTNFNGLLSDLPFSATPAPPSKRAKVTEAVATPTPSKKVKGTFVPGLDPEEDDPANFSDGYDEVSAVGPSQSSKQVVDAEEERKKTLALLGEMFGSGSDDEVAPSKDAEVVEVDEDEVESSSESGSDSDSSSESSSEAAVAPVEENPSSDSESISSSSESEDDQMAIDEDIVAEEQQQPDASMTHTPSAPVEAVASVAAPAMDAKSRRAAFLLSLSDPTSSERSAQSGSVIARFDPGTRAVTPPAPIATDDAPIAAAPQSESTPLTPAPAAPSAAQDDAAGTKVSMSTLKEMFKPQDRASTSGVTAGFSFGLGGDASSGAADDGGGFSLMDSLGLEFELEEDEPEPADQPHPVPSRWGHSAATQSSLTAASSAVEPPPKLAPFFPSSSSSSWNSTNQGSVSRWLKPRSQEEKESDWSKYKQSLTPVIKKRHREAARKHKRGFKSLPKPPPTAEVVNGR